MSKSFVRMIWVYVLALATLHAAAPDLTAPGVIAGIDRTDTYNLGPTGLRGWIYVNRANLGDSGLMTDESRQILVTTVSAPANTVLQTDDVILGAIAASAGTVPNFSSDCRKALGTAIGEAEKNGAGFLRLKIWRAGIISEQNIPLPIMGDYTATAPFACPKSEQILANARNQMVGDLLADPNYLVNNYSSPIHALALLASVKSGDPNYTTVQTRLQSYARSLASNGPVDYGLPIWDWSYQLLFLAEYYLLTPDSQVVTGINAFSLKLAQSQSMYGTYGHGPSAVRPDGSGRLVSIGYGPVNSVGVIANIALVLGKKALEAASQPINPEINSAIDRGSNFFSYYVNKGSIPYGEHEPVAQNHASNGKDPSAAVFFGLQANRVAQTEYFSRMSIAGWIGREYGHTGQGLSYLWAALGANMAGPHAATEHLKQVRWHLDLSRRSDGSFAYDGQEQYGGGTTSPSNTYLGRSDYYGLIATANYLLTYSLPLQRLFITGKSANPAYTLDTTKVANAVAAGSFRLDRTTKDNVQLIAALNEYDPVVRYYAAQELKIRTLNTGELTTLRGLLTSPNSNERQGACEALGLRQDATVLTTIVGLLNDPDLWVRAKAASAIRSYSSVTASSHRDAMINAFIANATDPDIINWNDPIQISNNKLSLALFGNGVPDGSPGNNIAAYTINAPKLTHLYPALRVGLKQPDSYPRTGVARFARDRLPLADVQALYPEIVQVAEYDTPADRMWSGDCRAEAIRLLGALKITEGIDLALQMLEVPENFGWGSDTYLVQALNALASYGDAARYTLPTLRGYLSQWTPGSTQYTTLVATINTLDSAITAPARAPGLCVANSQVVTTTGAKAITLTGASPRGSISYLNVTQPAHGTVTGAAPNLTYTPNPAYTGPDSFTFQTTDTLTTSATATVAVVVGSSGNGFKGEYFNNADFTSPVLTRTDTQINFDWGTGTPNAAIGADTFSVRWSGVLLVPESGDYQLSALSSDGIRLYVNGVLVIDRFTDQSTRWTDGQAIYLNAGQMADLYVEYYENTGSAVAKLKWTGPSFAGDNGAIIPQTYLFDGSTIPNRPSYAFPQNLSTNQNTALPITLNGSGGTLTYTVLGQPSNGTLSGTAPNLTYTPNNNFSGTDSFSFLVNNGSTNSLPATISISVQAGALTSFTWATATAGNWSDATKWTPGVPAASGQSNYALNFTPTGTYTATHNLNNSFQLNQLNNAANLTLAGSQSLAFTANGGTLPQFNQNSADQLTINSPLSFSAMTNFGGNGSGRVVINSPLTGSGGLIKNNPGTLDITSTANTFSGGTVINNGTLLMNLDANAALGNGSITINSGTLYLYRITATNPLIFNGGTLLAENGFGNNWNAPVTLNGNATLRCDYRLTINGIISGQGNLTKTSDGPLFLTASNTYTGSTNVTGGTLTCSNISALGKGPLTISIPAKVTLNYTGTRVIESLTLDGNLMPPGIYGVSNQSAYFTGTGTVTVPQPSTTSLILSNGSTPAAPGTSLTFTATVAGTSPTGSVQFSSGSSLLGTSVLNGSFQASFTTNQLAIGSHNITARYMGNNTNAPSTSPPVVVEIDNTPVSPPTNLTATPAITQVNLAWTASTAASGYYVKRSLTNGGPYTVIALVTGTSYQDTTIANSVTYHYVISAINAAGESADSNQATAFIGSASATTTTLTSNPVSSGVYGTSVAFTATVTSGSTPSGTVTFRSGSNIIGTDTLSSGVATLNISTLAVATHSVTATYEGSGSHDPSASAALSYQVTPKPLTINGITASNKIYDATTAATLSSGSLTGGVVGGETVTIVPGTGTFSSANAGTWVVTATSFALGGTHATNYTLSAQPTVPNATINARPIQITGTKIYDGATTAPAGFLAISNNLDAGNLSLTGTATLTSKDVGERPLLPGGNTPNRVQSAKGNTNNANTAINVSLASAPSDGNTLIAVISTRGNSANRVTGIIGGGVTWTRVTQATNANGTTTEIWIGPNITSGTTGITINQASLRSAAVVMEYSGLLVSNSFDVAANNTGNNNSPTTGITASTSQTNELWIGGIGFISSVPTLGTLTNSFTSINSASSTGSGNASNNSKIYALERIASIIGTATTGGTLSATAQWSGAIATFKAAPSLTLTGSAAGNYTLTGMTGTVSITPKILTISGLTPSNRVYNGTTTAPLTGTAALLAAQAPGAGTTSDGKPYTGDSLSLSGTAISTFATKHIGNTKAITVTGLTLSGTQSSNYTLTQPTGFTANVTPLPITVSAVSTTKTYDGTTSAIGTPTLNPVLASGDNTTILSQAFENATAGTSNKTVIPSITINDGNSGANYTVTLVNHLTSTINKAAQTITFGPLTGVDTGSSPFNLIATSSSGLIVSFSSSNHSVATLSGNVVTIIGAGSTTITASQPGDANYLAATPVPQTLVVTSPLTPYQEWLTEHPTLSEIALTDNSDGDALNNLLEFAFGTNPTQPSSGSLAYQLNGNVITPGSPMVQNFGSSESPEFHAVFARRKNYLAAGLIYTVEFSADLQTWTSSAITPITRSGPANTADVDAVSAPFPSSVPSSAGNKKPTYFRLLISLP